MFRLPQSDLCLISPNTWNFYGNSLRNALYRLPVMLYDGNALLQICTILCLYFVQYTLNFHRIFNFMIGLREYFIHVYIMF